MGPWEEGTGFRPWSWCPWMTNNWRDNTTHLTRRRTWQHQDDIAYNVQDSLNTWPLNERKGHFGRDARNPFCFEDRWTRRKTEAARASDCFTLSASSRRKTEPALATDCFTLSAWKDLPLCFERSLNAAGNRRGASDRLFLWASQSEQNSQHPPDW